MFVTVALETALHRYLLITPAPHYTFLQWFIDRHQTWR